MSDRPKTSGSLRAPVWRWLATAGRVGVLAVLGYFVYSTVSELVAGGIDDRLRLSFSGLGAASVVLVAYYILYAQGMVLILRGAGSKIRLRDAFALNFISNLGKYVPGGIWPLVGRYALASRYGVEREHAVMSTVYENLLSVVAGSIVVVIAVGPLATDALGVPLWTLPLVVLAVMTCLHPMVFSRLSRWALRLLKSDAPEMALSLRTMVIVVLHYMVTWCVGGIAFLLFVSSIVPADSGRLSLYIGAHAAASIGGLLVLFAPGGIGVREAILAVMLTPVHGSVIAVAVGVATRLWSTVVELVISAVAAGFVGRGASEDTRGGE